MSIWPFRALLLSATLGVCGCAGTGLPNFNNPGPPEYQRRMAEKFDPYPEKESAPEVEGGRPREFEMNRPEAARSRRALPRW